MSIGLRFLASARPTAAYRTCFPVQAAVVRGRDEVFTARRRDELTSGDALDFSLGLLSGLGFVVRSLQLVMAAWSIRFGSEPTLTRLIPEASTRTLLNN
jgi:hypothetical protein